MARRQLTEIERTTACPWCHARAGERCTTPDGALYNGPGGIHAPRRGVTAGTDNRQRKAPGETRMPRKPRYTFTRDSLIDALTRIEVRPVDGKVVAESMADAIIEALRMGNPVGGEREDGKR